MAVQERQKRGVGYKCFSSRLPKDVYDIISDWAWEHRMTLAKACCILLVKAMDAENGNPYVPESGGKHHGKKGN